MYKGDTNGFDGANGGSGAPHTNGSSDKAHDAVNGKTVHNEMAEDVEADFEEHVRDIGLGTVMAGAAYGACRLFSSKDQTEDLVDMLHSAASSSVALSGYMSMVPHPLHVRALPPHLASSRGPIVRMFKFSMGYFGADFMLIAWDIIVLRKFPKLWAGRVFHHVVQLGANSPAIFGKDKSPQHNLAVRSTLCMAYLAEISSVFLRVSNMYRQGALISRQLINWTLVATFFYCRVLNFPRAVFMYIKARPVVSPEVFRLQLSIQAAGCFLSAGWFGKIVQIAMKTREQIPSIEC